MKTRVKGMDITTTMDDVVVSIKIPKRKAEAIMDELERLKGEDLDFEIKKHRYKRSLNANSYAWVLINNIAEKISADPVEVYRKFIRESGKVYVTELSEKAIPVFSEVWSAHGIGWMVETLDYSYHDGMKVVRAFFGSSTYNTKEMSRFIDNIVHEARGLGLETMTPAELEGLKAAWQRADEPKQ